MSKRILVSWVGHADIRALGRSLPTSKRNLLPAEALNAKEHSGDGPVRALLEIEKFDNVHLLADMSAALAKEFSRWMPQKVSIHLVSLGNPTDYAEVLGTVRGFLESLTISKSDRLCFHLSPGTPAMAAIWILLGKSVFPAKFFQTHNNRAWITEVPFDLTVDFLPDLLREPDRYWQHLVESSPQETKGFEQIIGNSPSIRFATGRAQRAAIHDVPVLILGESGTGKEMFASAIHAASHRRSQPFVALNCAAISRELLESELFGHTKGAFTGANEYRKGAFEQANGGTLFLDEIGECDPANQAKLLRALQPPPGDSPSCRVFRPVGAIKDAVVDVRVIAATNRDLNAEIEKGSFRQDLLFRLSTITLKLPPLRERGHDIELLSEKLLADINGWLAKHGNVTFRSKTLSAEAKRFLRNHHWPGNIRQLYNVLVQAAVMSSSNKLGFSDLEAAAMDFPDTETSRAPSGPEIGNGFDLEEYLDGIRRTYLQRAIHESNGNKSKAAKLLGFRHYQTLDTQLQKFGIKFSKT